MVFYFFFFFKQKTAYEILGMTGVQTCALPICEPRDADRPPPERQPGAPGGGPKRGDARLLAVRALIAERVDFGFERVAAAPDALKRQAASVGQLIDDALGVVAVELDPQCGAQPLER